MLILAVLLALAVGYCTGGRLSRYEEAGLRLLPLPVAALLLQRIPGLFSGAQYDAWGWILVLCSYPLLAAFFLCNRRLRKTVLLMGGGSACNLLVIAVNGWRMPVAVQAALLLSPEGLAALTSRQIPMYALADGSTRLLFLGDILYCPVPLFQGFASAGDLLLAAGVFFALLAVMAPVRLPRWLCSG